MLELPHCARSLLRWRPHLEGRPPLHPIKAPCLALTLLLAATAGAQTPPAPKRGQPPARKAAARPPASKSSAIRVLLETGKGNIELELDAARAPVSVANFLQYVDSGLYDGGRFHRTVKPDNQPNSPVRIEVIQGGPAPANAARGFPPIPLERTRDTGLTHRDGTLSMARDGPDSATSDFFICIGDQPELDFGGKRNPDGQGFAAFGRVVEGMDVVRAIQAAPAQGQQLAPAIPILRAQRVPR